MVIESLSNYLRRVAANYRIPWHIFGDDRVRDAPINLLRSGGKT